MNYHTPPPAGYYGFTSASPSPQGPPGFFSPRGASPRMHSRHASQDYSYSPRPTSTYPSPRYSSKGYYATAPGHASPLGKAEYVSARGSQPLGSYRYTPPRPSHRASYEDSDQDEDLFTGYIRVAPPRRKHFANFYSTRGHGTDQWYSQGRMFTFDRARTPIIITEPESPRPYPGDDDTPRRSRSRRHSSSTPQRPASAAATSRPTAPPRKPPPPPTPKATEEDARRHKIPPGYSLKNWDPTEEPIMLLGSVFDANSLGKWIYDWTVYHHGPATPISDMAGELWLLLIQLAGKMKRADECVPRIRKDESRDMVEDFIESGERLVDKLKKLLKTCENPMLRAGKKSSKDGAQLGKNAGIEFVESIFGRDRQLDYTEKFMSSVRLWNMRFDANCEDIIRHPYA